MSCHVGGTIIPSLFIFFSWKSHMVEKNSQSIHAFYVFFLWTFFLWKFLIQIMLGCIHQIKHGGFFFTCMPCHAIQVRLRQFPQLVFIVDRLPHNFNFPILLPHGRSLTCSNEDQIYTNTHLFHNCLRARTNEFIPNTSVD